MDYPVCGKSHKIKQKAQQCFNEIQRDRTFYVIAYDCKVPKQYEKQYKENERMLSVMKEYMKQFKE